MKPVNKTSWGKVAGWYDELLEQSKDSFQEKVILPNLLRLLDIKKGMAILDIACGQGYFARAFHEKGASVTGCDISPELIEIAKKHSPKEIGYFTAPADRLTEMSGKFDAVTIILAVQNIENISGVFAECAKVLKPGGRAVVVLNHPAFRIPKRSSWGWDDAKKNQYRRVDGYMSDERLEMDMNPGESNDNRKKYTVSFHRPLQTYFKLLGKNSFAVTRLEEWISHKTSERGPRAEEEDRMRKEIPLFIAIVAEKIARK